MCSSIVGVNTTSDRLIIGQLEHEITQKERESKKRQTEKYGRGRPIRKEGDEGQRETSEYREKTRRGIKRDKWGVAGMGERV